jgi:GT2 family glycosyltransferase
MTKPILSIIIPTWNTSLVTQKCLESIRNYLPVSFAEIIVVDNGSTDDTQAFFSKLKNIKYIRNSTNLGFSKANNIGAKLSTCKYLLFLNSDMEFIDNKLSDMLDFYRQTPDCGLVGPQFLNPDLTIQASVFPDQSILNAVKEFWFNQISFSKYYPKNFTKTKVWAISGGAVLLSREMFMKIGEWDERYFMYYEDLDLCRKVRNLGKNIYYFPEFKIIHRHGFSGRNLVDPLNQWRRLIPSSKLYFGIVKHNLLFFITWTRRQWQKIIN